MSLNFNLGQITDYENVCFDDEGTLSPVTETLIFGAMLHGYNRITDSNCVEIFARYNVYNSIRNFSMINITFEDVKRHIGLSTNCVDETRLQWAKRVLHPLITEVANDAARESEV